MPDATPSLRPEIPCVFISACTRDLKTFRTVLSANLLRLGFHPIVQEDFTLTYLPLKQKLEELIARCDFVIHLAGHAYGAEPRQQPEGIRRSYTQHEYYFARESGKPVYAFLCADDFPYDRPDARRYPRPESDELLQLQETHRQFVKGTPENREYAKVTSIREGVQLLSEVQPRFKLICQHLESFLPAVHSLQKDTLAAIGTLSTDMHRRFDEIMAVLEKQATARGYARIWNVPAGADRFFGREEEFVQLLALWDQHPRLAITGMGGLGKTALARELLDWFGPPSGHTGPFPRRLLQHDYYRQPSHLSALDALLRQAGHDPRELTEDQMETALTQELNKADTFLYLEGCEKAEALPSLLALSGSARVLLTTRSQTAPHGTQGWPLPPLKLADAAALIAHLAGLDPQDVPASYHDLARFLGGHALACRLAGNLLARKTRTATGLLAELNKAGLSRLGTVKHEHQSVDWLLRQTALALEVENPGSIRVWYLLALGALSPLPLSLLGDMLGLDNDTLLPLLDALQDQGIVLTDTVSPESGPEPEPAAHLAHALIQTFALRDLPTLLPQGQNLDPGENYTAWRDTWRAYLHRCNANRGMIGGYRRLEALLSQFDTLLQRLDEKEPADSAQHAPVLNEVAVLYHHSGRFLMAEPLYRQALQMEESKYGLCHPGLATALNNLAWLLQDTNRLAEAEPLMRQALKINEASYAPDHSKVAITLNNLALLLGDTNRMAEAELLMRRALKIAEASYGPDHPDVARELNNLAHLLQATNRLAEAEPLMRRALKIVEVSDGPDHLKVALHLNNLAQLLQKTNRLTEAEPLMAQVVDILEKAYGENHPTVAAALNNLAQLLQATNRLLEAEPLLVRVVDILKNKDGDPLPNYSVALNNLAQLLYGTNRLAEAEPLIRRAMEIDEAIFGSDHPNVASRLNNLAQLLLASNRLAEAEPLIRRALQIDEASYGSYHPDVARDLNTQVQTLLASNRLAEAEPLIRRALQIDEASYGPDHPDVARDLNNLAQLLQATNRLEEAEPLMRRALKIDEASYGLDHPLVAIRLNNLAQLLQATNRLAEAEPLMRRHLVIFLQFQVSTGHPHPHREAAIRNYRDLLQEMGRAEGEIEGVLRGVFAEAGVEWGEVE